MATELLSRPDLEPGMIVEMMKVFPKATIRIVLVVAFISQRKNAFGFNIDAATTDTAPKVYGLFRIEPECVTRIWRFGHSFYSEYTGTDYVTWPDQEEMLSAIAGDNKHCIWRSWLQKREEEEAKAKEEETQDVSLEEEAPSDAELDLSGVETVTVAKEAVPTA